jgi:hypothetical protein
MMARTHRSIQRRLGVHQRADGGGKRAAARKPIRGPMRVARFFASLWQKAEGHVTVHLVRVNGAGDSWSILAHGPTRSSPSAWPAAVSPQCGRS